MYIKRVHLENFKGFIKEDIVLKIPDNKSEGSGLNVFVGPNNSGKSTFFEALKFLKYGLPKNKEVDDLKNINNKNKDLAVEVEFAGNIKEMINNFSQKKLEDYIGKNNNGEEVMKACRSSKIYEVNQGGKKPVQMNIQKIGVWNFKNEQYENPSGLAADFQKFIEMEFIWSDTNPDDITSFGATTACGKLLSDIVKNFKNESEEDYKKLKDAHDNVFNNPTSGLKKKLNSIEEKAEEIFEKQFGGAKIEFNFDEIDIDSYFKKININVDDGEKTKMEEKGGGMQRSVALALLQVYADHITKHPEIEDALKPFYLFVDEPEICLHPQSQIILLDFLKTLSRKNQIFLSTHSIYFVPPQKISNIYKFLKSDEGGIKLYYDKENKITDMKENRVFMLHHRQLFFTDKVIIVEGACDLERYSLYCEKNRYNNSREKFLMLGGCGDYKKFFELGNIFNIKIYFVTDVDFINSDFKYKYGLEARPNKQWHREHCLEKKYKEIYSSKYNDLLDENILLLSRPDVKDFLDKNGECFEGKNCDGDETVGTKEDKEGELNQIFGKILDD
jgi:predicted ATP-dependent endonuclease of OLD family